MPTCTLLHIEKLKHHYPHKLGTFLKKHSFHVSADSFSLDFLKILSQMKKTFGLIPPPPSATTCLYFIILSHMVVFLDSFTTVSRNSVGQMYTLLDNDLAPIFKQPNLRHLQCMP